jgi:Domain of unknown function (DUF4260)
MNGIVSGEGDNGMVRGGVRAVLRIEAACVLTIAVWAYALHGAGWAAFAWCFLIPDLSFLGYLVGRRVGATCYNIAHSVVGPIALLAVALLTEQSVAMSACLIWFAHVGFDRMLGYGLKYESGFHDTHLGRIGRRSAQR